MATYKAEFLAHYYKGRLRPLNAYAFGYIDEWSRLATHLPGARERVMAPSCSLAKTLLDIPPQRRCPPSPRDPSPRIPPARGSGMKVDPVAGHLQQLFPSARSRTPRPRARARRLRGARARAAALLRPAALRVRPARLGASLPAAYPGVLDDDIRAGTPIVGLEPACVSVFREELPNLFAHDEQAKRLSQQVFLLSEFLRAQGARVSPSAEWPQSGGARALPPPGGAQDGRASARCWSASGSTSRCSTRAAAAWPARSASRRRSTTSR